MPTVNEVREVLKKVIDPEIGIDIISLGFVYDIKVENNKIKITMTLSSPGCPLASYIFSNIEDQIEENFKGYDIDIDLTFDPPWNPKKMTKWAKEQLGWHDED